MKASIPTVNHKRFVISAGRLLAVLALGALAVLPLRADTVYVTTYTGSTLTVCPPYCNNPLGLTTSISTFGSTAIASPPGVPSRTKCTYGYAGEVNWSIQPPTTVDGGVYRIETAHVSVTASPDVLVTVWSADGTVSASCTNSPVFQQSYGGNTWQTIGYITNSPGVTSPTIIFLVTGGTVGPTSSQNRVYIDAFKFTLIDPCADYVEDVIVTGPLAAGQTYVPVTGITAGATNVTVYADDSEIGQTNYTAGFAAGSLNVPVTSPLYQGAVIKATQCKPNLASPAGHCTSTYPSTGPVVGGGANPQLSVVLTCGTASGLTGPAGADTSGAASVEYHVKCTGLAGAGGTAPVGGATLTPGSCWQTVSFDIINDPCRAHQSNTDYDEPNPYCVMIALSFAIDSTSPDTGPYDIYVDQIKNGDTIIENFEGWNSGDGVMFNNPNVATIPPPGATYLGAPNSALVSQANAYEGTNSCRIQWQFATADTIRWARVLANRANGATYPQLDTSKPVTVRFLVLPVGETTNKLSVGTIPSQTKNVGESVTFTAPAKGEGTFTYQWKKDGNDLGISTSSYTIGSVTLADAGLYSVVVDNAACDPVESSPAQLTVNAPVQAPVTISNIVGNVISYGGGAGSQFVLLQSASITAARNTWTRVATNSTTPGSFTIPGGALPATPGAAFYCIQSE